MALVIATLSAAGAVYEAIAAPGDAKRFPPPGRLEDIGGHRLHITCLGKGDPTVVLDAGLGGTALDWALVQSRISQRTRVCAYDRAGMGHSDAGPAPRTPLQIAGELNRLLAKAEIPPPYILVAHSLSGKSARHFAAAHPEDVVGMVLVDTRSERIDAATTTDEARAFNTALERQATLLSLARRIGLVRLFGSGFADLLSLPPDKALETLLLQTQPKSLKATTQEGASRAADDPALANASLGSIPIVVIAAGESMAVIPGWTEAQTALAALSTKGQLVVAEASSHNVQVDDPGVVLDAVMSVLEEVRGPD